MTINKHKIIFKVSIISATINTLLAIFKVIIGKIGHSQALIADGIHSFSDLISDALVYIAAKASGRDPDPEHPYGHQRIETIATIIIALVLLAVGFSLCYEAIIRILNHTSIPKPTEPVIIAAFISILANEWLFYYSKKNGEKINSNLLISNAWHNRTDAFASIIVLLAAIGSISGLRWLDAVGAILIALLIIKMAGKMIWEATKELVDSGVDEQTLKEISDIIISVPGVKSLHQLRTRFHGGNIFVDCHIIVNPRISVSEGHHIGENVHMSLVKKHKQITDVTVHIDPEDDENCMPSMHLPSRSIIEKQLKEKCSNLPGYNDIKNITLHYLAGKFIIQLYLPYSYAKDVNLKQKYQEALKDYGNIKTIEIYFIHE